MNSKLFTIIIPTYNRCKMLEQSLEVVIPQVRKFKDEVCLYISDNASTDNTKTIVEKYMQGNKDILSYYRQSENIGGQNNFKHAVKAVDSKYVCLIGDDDVVFPNYVETIVGLLKNNPEIGLINYNVMSVNYDLQNASFREANIRDLHPIVYADGGSFIYDHLELPSLISSNVFNRANFIKWLDKIPVGTYPGYNWLAILYKSIFYEKCLFVGLPLLLQRMPGSQRWECDLPWFIIYGLGKIFKDLDKDKPGLYSRWKEYCQKEYRGMLNHILRKVSENKELYKPRFETMRPYMCSKEYERQFRLRINHSNRCVEFINSPVRFFYSRLQVRAGRIIAKLKR